MDRVKQMIGNCQGTIPLLCSADLRRLGRLASLFLGVVVPAANLAAELQGRDAYDSTEDLREMALIGETGRLSCAGQGELRVAQVLLRAFNSALQNVLVWRQACAYLE